jgi:hypothetical protein
MIETTKRTVERVVTVQLEVQQTDVLLHDHQIKNIKRNKDSLDITFINEGETEEITIGILLDHITKAYEACQPQMTPEQIRAMHARRAEEEQKHEQEQKQELPKIAALIKPQQTIVTLEREEPEWQNWKDTSDVREAKRSYRKLSPSDVESLIHSALGWYVKARHRKKNGQKQHSLQFLMDIELPKQFDISQETAKKIYTGKTHVEITGTPKIRSRWAALINNCDKNNLGYQVPPYLREAYS